MEVAVDVTHMSGDATNPEQAATTLVVKVGIYILMQHTDRASRRIMIKQACFAASFVYDVR